VFERIGLSNGFLWGLPMNKILITGAGRGIGLELCRQLVARGDEVIAVYRTGNSALRSLNLRVVEGIDVATNEPIPAASGTLTVMSYPGRRLPVPSHQLRRPRKAFWPAHFTSTGR